MWSFNRVFSLKRESSSWSTSGTFNTFLSLFQFIIQFYLEHCLPYLSTLLLEISSNFLVTDHVVLFSRKLWFSGPYFSAEKDAASCLFCFMCSMLRQFYKYIRSLNPIILNHLYIGFADSWRFLDYLFKSAILKCLDLV